MGTLLLGLDRTREGRLEQQHLVHLGRAFLTPFYHWEYREGHPRACFISEEGVRKGVNDIQRETYRAALRRSSWICRRRSLPSWP
jgi:hypothetical protein